MALLVSNRVRVDVVGLIVLSLISLLHLVPSTQLFLGFSSTAAILIAGIFALGEGLRQAGATDMLAAWLERVGARGERPLLSMLLVMPPIPSTFVSDVGLMAIFLPALLRLKRILAISVGRVLMPLAVSIALGGLLSMIGSAGNIIGNSALAQKGIAPLGLFAITPLGLVLVCAGILYMRTIGLRLLPSATDEPEFVTDYAGVKAYLTDIRVRPDSPLIGQALADIAYFRQHQVAVVRIVRQDRMVAMPGPHDVLAADDRLVVQGDREAVLALSSTQGLEVVAEPGSARLRQGPSQVAEVLIPQGSVLSNQSLAEMNFRGRYHLTVLAIWRQGRTTMTALPKMRIRSGDVMLLQGAAQDIGQLQMNDDVVVLTATERRQRPASHEAYLAVGIMGAALLAAALNVLALTVAVTLGVTVMVLTGLLTLPQAYRAIDWRIIVLIGGMTPLSLALDRTGMTALLARHLVSSLDGYGPLAVLAAFFWLSALLTQVISNVATALVLSPLAISVAQGSHWSPYPLIIAMVVALSAAPITPLANKVYLMAMGPGHYAYKDFFKLGIPLTVLMFCLSLVLIPIFFPFVPA
ncbi:MAG: SLC13 family permease [Thermaerobacter sp.]|nr:SLC13 family permease [Thermaerobacter sp.]